MTIPYFECTMKAYALINIFWATLDTHIYITHLTQISENECWEKASRKAFIQYLLSVSEIIDSYFIRLYIWIYFKDLTCMCPNTEPNWMNCVKNITVVYRLHINPLRANFFQKKYKQVFTIYINPPQWVYTGS